MTGTKAVRPQLNRLKDKIRPGDTVIVESFSRLGRSTKDLIDLVTYFEEHHVKLVSLKEKLRYQHASRTLNDDCLPSI